MLYDPELHEPLTDEPWDEGRVRDAIGRIVADADAAFDPEQLWPAEEWDVYLATPPLKNLYVGASGVIWALDALRRRGLAETAIDLPAAAARTLELWRELPDYAQWESVPEAAASALLTGESGPLIVAWRLAPSAELADELYARVRENVGNEAVEIMFGAPGTMLAAQAMHEWTGEERWAEAWQESAESVWAARDDDGLWTNRLYGETFRSLTAPHGLVGIVLALRPDPRREQLERETADALAGLAVREDGLVNWPTREVMDEPRLVLQWCSGAPGIVAGAVVLPRRGAAPRRRRADLAGGPVRHGEGIGHLPRDGRERPRVPEGLRAHRRRALARAGATLCDARARPGRAARIRPLLAVDGRRGRCALRGRLHRRRRQVSGSRVLGLS